MPWRSLHAAGGVWATRRSRPAQWTVMDQALGASGWHPSWRGWSQHQPGTAPAAAPARCNLPCAGLVPTSGSSLVPSGGDQSLLGAFAASGSAPGVAEPQLGGGRRAAGGGRVRGRPPSPERPSSSSPGGHAAVCPPQGRSSCCFSTQVWAPALGSGAFAWLWFRPNRLKGSERRRSPHRQGKPHGWGAGVTAVRQDVSVCLSGGCEPVGAALPSSSGGGDAGAAALLPDEEIALRRAGGALNPSRQRGCFQRETAAKGCRIPLLLFIGSCVRAGRVRARPRGAGRILPAGRGSAPLPLSAHGGEDAGAGHGVSLWPRAERGPGSSSHCPWHGHGPEGWS